MISLTTACKALRDTTEAGQATNQTTHIAPPEQRSFSVSRRLSSGYLNNIRHWIVVISTEKYSNCSVAYAENMTKLKWLVLDQICPGNCICIFPFYETRLRKMHLLCSCPWLCWGEPWANPTYSENEDKIHWKWGWNSCGWIAAISTSTLANSSFTTRLLQCRYTIAHIAQIRLRIQKSVCKSGKLLLLSQIDQR